jgi:hypothetical protein
MSTHRHEAKVTASVHLLGGGNHPLEFTQEDLSAHYGVKFLDALCDLFRRELLYALNKDFFGPESDFPWHS